MVQILPPKTDVGSMIGQGLGQGLGAGIKKGADIGFQRNLTNQALQGLENLPKDTTPSQLAAHLIRATAGDPNAGRYLGMLYQTMLPLVEAERQKNIPQPGQPGAFGQGATQTQAQPQLPIDLPEAATSLGQGFENIGMGVGPMPSTYSPEQYRQVEQQYLSSGLDPSQALGRMQERDQIARQRFQDIEKAAVEQAEFSNFYKEKNPNVPEEDMPVIERISLKPDIRAIKNQTLRADAVRKQYQLFEAAKKGFQTNSKRFNIDAAQHKAQLETMARNAKVMVDNGQRDLAEADLADNEWGPIEREKILNPLPEKLENGFKTLPELKDINEQITVLPDDPRYDAQAQKAFQGRNQQIQKFKDFIAKDFQTGQYDTANAIKPGTSLLLLRDQAMKRGVNFREFEKMIHDLEKSGDIVLDKYQQKERNEYLPKHPMASFGLGEILFRANPFYINRQ